MKIHHLNLVLERGFLMEFLIIQITLQFSTANVLFKEGNVLVTWFKMFEFRIY